MPARSPTGNSAAAEADTIYSGFGPSWVRPREGINPFNAGLLNILSRTVMHSVCTAGLLADYGTA